MLIELKNIQKTYCAKNGVTFRALNNISTTFDSSGLVYLVGASGSGKSTLLNIIGGLDSYDGGELILAGKRLDSLSGAEVDSLRNTLMGFVFQEFNLIDTLSVYDNVKLALDMQSHKGTGAADRALEQLGIADKAKNKTKDLSGGQRQRVGIARAIVKDPRIILADEPTGSLDSATGKEVTDILKEMSKTRLVIVVTHDMDTALKTGDRIIEMKDGRIYRDVRRKKDGEVIELSEAEMYSDTLMVLPEGTKAGEADAKKLNEVLSRSSRKSYINVEADPRKVKALFPNLREAVGATKKKEKDENVALSDDFVPFKRADGEMESVEFKKSRLRPLTAVRLALNNLNHKKVRLAITIIVAFLAFALFGVAQSFANYDLRAAIAKTIEKDGDASIAVTLADSDFYNYGSGYTVISDNEIDRIKNAYPSVKYVSQYPFEFSVPQAWENHPYDPLTKFEGIIETDDVETMDRKILYGSGKLTDYSRAVISEYAARSIILSGDLGAGDMSELIGKSLTDERSGCSVEISGIFECKDAEKWITDLRYIDFMEEYSKRMLVLGGWGQLYVKPGFARRIYESEAEKGTALDFEIKSDTTGYKASGIPVTAFYGADSPSEISLIPVVGDGSIVGASDIVVTAGVLDMFADKSGAGTVAERTKKIAEALNADASRRLTLRAKTLGAVDVSDSFRIVGIIDSDEYGVYLHESGREKLIAARLRPSMLYGGIAGLDVRGFVDAVYESGFAIVAAYTATYDMAVAALDVLHIVLLIISLVFCALVILLLFGFISISIKLTRKHIGILRALGAKKSDTFLIYALEGLLVTLFSLVLAFVTLAVGAPLLNAVLSAQSGFYFALFTVTAPVYFTMIAVAAVVTLASVFIPLRKFNKITPVSAINGKD